MVFRIGGHLIRISHGVYSVGQGHLDPGAAHFGHLGVPGMGLQTYVRRQEGREEEAISHHLNCQLDLSVCHLYARDAPYWAALLATNMAIVARLAKEMPMECWLCYDGMFRQAAAVTPALPWDRREPDVWLAAMVEWSTLVVEAYDKSSVSKLTAHSFLAFVNTELLPSCHLPENAPTWISLRCVYRWMHKMGFRYL